MVKIPGLDDLKKMGADLIDSAKSVNISETVDKLKSKMESLGSKKDPIVVSGDNPAQTLLNSLSISLNELMAAQAIQANSLRKIQEQLAELAKVIAANQKPATTATPGEMNSNQEDIKK